jgi:hypothetical protein
MVDDSCEDHSHDTENHVPMSPLADFEDMLSGVASDGQRKAPKVHNGNSQVKPKRGRGRPNK